jgi:transcriptional regulator with PAS, ATPase and Fis domain
MFRIYRLDADRLQGSSRRTQAEERLRDSQHRLFEAQAALAHVTRVTTMEELAPSRIFSSLDLVKKARVCLTTSPASRELAIRTQRDERNGVQVAVRDAGVEFPPAEDAHRLFDAFYTTKSSDVRGIIRKVGPAPTNVLITGESGVGKERVARAIHRVRRDKLFLPVNCGAIPEELLESQLFGHDRGAFTGAVIAREGLFQVARGGTIFLDEIGDLPLCLQVKLLRAIQEREILPLGAATPVKIDVRILAATNRDLDKRLAEGQFREDLFYRLNVVNIDVPPLRERREDIPHLVRSLLRRYNAMLGKSYDGVDNTTMMMLMSLPWKGNIRELENVIEYAMIFGNGRCITLADLPRSVPSPSSPLPLVTDDLRSAVRAYEKFHIENTLRGSDNNKRKAAKRLGLGLSSLYRKLDDLRIRP